MPNVLIRDLDEATHDRLKEKAVALGMSLQAYLGRVLSQEADRLTADEWEAFVARRLAELRGPDPDRDASVKALDQERAERDARWDRLAADPPE